MTNDEAIRVLKNTAWLGSEEDLEAVETAIETLDNPWVPCSERLPKTIDKELLGDYDSSSPCIVTYKRHAYVGVAEVTFVYCSDRLWRWNPNTEYETFEPIGDECEVIAWMPLPEAYKKSNERQCTVASANVESYGESY